MTRYISASEMLSSARSLELYAMAARASGNFNVYAKSWAKAQRLRGEVELIQAQRRALTQREEITRTPGVYGRLPER